MFRRSRFSIRPNVGVAGRTAATPHEAPLASQEASETPKDVSDSNTSVTENQSVVTPSEKPTVQGEGNDQNGEGTNGSAAFQRRKRFAIKPKVAPGRPSVLARTTRSPAKAVSEAPFGVPDAVTDKPTTTSQTTTTAAPQGLQSPRRRRPSEDSRQPKVQPKPAVIPSDSSGPPAVAPAENSQNETHLSADSSKQSEHTSPSQLKVHLRGPDKVPPSLPDKEAIEISERAKTLVSSKRRLSLSPAAFSLSRLLNDPSDIQRLAKAQKLRELLKEEIHKEKKIKKSKLRVKEFTLDPAKMTMKDLIHYLPESNPMTTNLEDPTPENETIVPPSPGRVDSPERAQEPAVLPQVASPPEEEEEEAAEEEQEEALVVPQVKVAEDGSLIIDEESLTVEVQRAKGPNPAQDRDPIFECGSTTTYSSFRKGTYTKPWSSEETDMFFLAISMVGTDFSMICQLFPHRARSEIKNKFKKEERENTWRIDKAFRERRKLDIEYFSKLLEKILEVQKNRKKLKSLADKNSRRKNKGKAKGKKAARKSVNVDEEEDNELSDLEEEGQKENEDLGNDGGSPVSKPKKKRKRKNEQDASGDQTNDKKNKTDEQDETCIPEDADTALPEGHANSDTSEKTENLNAPKDTAIKPAKLSRARAPKPLLQLGRKWGKKPLPPSTEANDASDKMDKTVNDETTEEQTNKAASPTRNASKSKSGSDDISSEEEDSNIHPPRPTRYGRIPKPTKPLTYSDNDETNSTVSETAPASPAGSTSATKQKPKCTAKRKRSSKPQSVQESKKPKLVTLRASQSEYSDDEENEKQLEEEGVEEEQQLACSSSSQSSAAAFVPSSLRSPHPVIAEVEETMEELDILVNMPDVLGISQDALCPDVTCKLAQNEPGLAEPCEHQLDLLVDVIDCLSSEYTVSEEESYNEAAQTLLTIGNLAHLSQSTQNQTVAQDHTAGTTSVSVDETSQNLEEAVPLKPVSQDEFSDSPLMSATSGKVTEMSETVATVEIKNSTPDDGDVHNTATSHQSTGPAPQLQSSPEKSEKTSSQTRRGCSSKVKPKPNLSQASRTRQQKSQPETSTGMTAIERPATSSEASENQSHCSSDSGLELSVEQPTRESTDEAQLCDTGKSKISSVNLATSDTAVTQIQRPSIHPLPVQQSSEHSAPSVTPVNNLPVSQKEGSEDAATQQTRSSRIQKVKPNITKMSRTALESTEAFEVDSTCISSPEKQVESCPASDFVPSIGEGSALTSTEELSPTQEKSTNSGVNSQVKSGAVTSDHKASGNRLIPETTRDTSPTPESTEGKTVCCAETKEASAEPGPKTDSAPETSEDCAPPTVHNTQKEERKSASTHLTGRSRFPKVKPKPNIALTSRTARSKAVNTKDTAEKDSNATPKPKIHEKTPADAEEEPTIISPEKQGSGSASDFMSCDVRSALTPAEELSTSEEKKSVDVVGQVESSTATSDQKSPESQNFSEVQFESSREKVTRDTSPASGMALQTSDSTVPPKVGPESNRDSAPIQESSDHPASRIPHAEESPAESEVPSSCQNTRGKKLKPTPNLTRTSAAQSKPQTTEDPVIHLQPEEKPSSPTSRPTSSNTPGAETEVQPTSHSTPPGRPSEIKSIGTATLLVPPRASCSSHKPAEELPSTEDQKTDVGTAKVSPSGSSEKSEPPRRQRFAKVKPNLGSYTTNKATKLQRSDCSKPSDLCQMGISSKTSDQLCVNPQPAETDSEHLTSTHCSSQAELKSLTKLRPAESQMSVDRPNDKGTKSEGVVVATPLEAESVSVLTGSVVGQRSSEKPTAEGESTGDMVTPGLASQWDYKEHMSVRVTETNALPMDDPTAILDVGSSGDGSAESKIKSPNTESTSDPKERTQQQSQDAVQQSSEATETNPAAAQSTRGNESEPPNSSKSARKAPQTPRGRLVKPKPNLGHSRQSQQVQKTAQAKTDSVSPSEDLDALMSQSPVSRHQSDIQKPVEGAIEQHNPLNDAGSSLGCLTQVAEQLSERHSPPQNVAGPSQASADSVTQDGSTSSTGGNQSQPNLTLFSDMLSEQTPSDSNESFVILTLTEIPVSSLGEVLGGTSEPLPCLPVTDASVQQQSVPGEGLATAGDVAVPVSAEATVETGLITVKDIVPDPAAYGDSVMMNPADPHETESSTVQPSAIPESAENNKEPEHPPTQQGPRSTQSKAKLRASPKTPRRKLANQSLTVTETGSIPTEMSDLPGPSVEPKTDRGSGSHASIRKETLMGLKDPEENSSGAQTRRTASRRKPKGSPSSSEIGNTAPLSCSPPTTAVSKSSKVKTPRTVGKRSTPVASASNDITPTVTHTQLSEETHVTPTTTSQIQFSGSQQSVESSSKQDEEPTSVSQYFLSDIFTEVEEG